jgi:hypothetical protein
MNAMQPVAPPEDDASAPSPIVASLPPSGAALAELEAGPLVRVVLRPLLDAPTFKMLKIQTTGDQTAKALCAHIRVCARLAEAVPVFLYIRDCVLLQPDETLGAIMHSFGVGEDSDRYINISYALKGVF